MPFHNLRHAAATLLRARGLDLKTIQTVLGHSSYRVTADTYSKVFVDELREAADIITVGSLEDIAVNIAVNQHGTAG